ncbi:type II toxin-antitoxin system VapC family toxin [soil metagenome]
MVQLRYLFDTNILSVIIKQQEGELARRIAKLSAAEFCTSIVVASELRFGAHYKNSAKLTALVETLLLGITVLPLDEPADHHYAVIRNQLQCAGQLIGANDLLIAAHARSLNVTLVTANEREFNKVPELRVENWLK